MALGDRRLLLPSQKIHPTLTQHHALGVGAPEPLAEPQELLEGSAAAQEKAGTCGGCRNPLPWLGIEPRLQQ